MKVFSIEVEADFGVFRDPSVTSSQSTYTVPSKSKVVGFLAALIGIHRKQYEKKTYSEDIVNFFNKTKIGISVNDKFSKPEKITMKTNHRSLDAEVTKPFTAEFVVNPAYTFYFTSSSEYLEEFKRRLPENNFVFTPYFGHAFCLARVNRFEEYSVKEIKLEKGSNLDTKSVIIEENMETYDDKTRTYLINMEMGRGGSLIIERHLHHMVNSEGKLDRRVLRYYSPFGTSMNIIVRNVPKLASFVKIDGESICLF